MSIKIISNAKCVYSWLLFNVCTSYPNHFFFLLQEESSSYIFSLASITMANHQEYSFTQFPSIQMVRSFLQYVSMLNSFVFLVYMYRNYIILKLLELH